jgi:hypothetical protein
MALAATVPAMGEALAQHTNAINCGPDSLSDEANAEQHRQQVVQELLEGNVGRPEERIAAWIQPVISH